MTYTDGTHKLGAHGVTYTKENSLHTKACCHTAAVVTCRELPQVWAERSPSIPGSTSPCRVPFPAYWAKQCHTHRLWLPTYLAWPSRAKNCPSHLDWKNPERTEAFQSTLPRLLGFQKRRGCRSSVLPGFDSGVAWEVSFEKTDNS